MCDLTPQLVISPTSEALFLKKDAPLNVIESVARMEERADECFHSLEILAVPPSVSLWALIVNGIFIAEGQIDQHGDDSHRINAPLINISHFVSTAMRLVNKRGNRFTSTAQRNWTPELARRTEIALGVARNYDAFLTTLPMWHRDRYGVQLLSPVHARFTVVSSEMDRRVSAYQKGFRPTAGRHRAERPRKPNQTAKVQKLFEIVFAACKSVGMLGFTYDDPWMLWNELLPEYRSRVAAISRRDDSLSIGDYNLGEFKQFYAALFTICATHEHLCFAWRKNTGRHPMNTVVMVRSLEDWSNTLAKLSRVSSEKCKAITKDLTFDFGPSSDLHVYPFVALDASVSQLALPPHFPLHSNAEENILRVCSKLRPQHFSLTTLKKEPEMFAALKEACKRYAPEGPIQLPKPFPDIDLLLTDDKSSTVFIAELKWIRKPTKIAERIDRDEDVLKGFRQLRMIRTFFAENPDHLVVLKKLRKPLHEYKNVQYAVIARDHFPWVEPTADGDAIFSYESFIAAIGEFRSLKDSIDDLFTYDWLPIAGRDYTISYNKSVANGITIETEHYYPT